MDREEEEIKEAQNRAYVEWFEKNKTLIPKKMNATKILCPLTQETQISKRTTLNS